MVDLFKKEGSFGAMELAVKKFQSKVYDHGHSGAWVTKQYLMTEKKWTKCFDLAFRLLVVAVAYSF